MSGRGKGGKAKGKSKTRSSRAGLQFPVGRIHRHLRKGNYAARVGAELHVVDSLGHPSFADWNRTVARRANSGTPVNSHFLKLPMLQWFLERFDRVLFLVGVDGLVRRFEELTLLLGEELKLLGLRQAWACISGAALLV